MPRTRSFWRKNAERTPQRGPRRIAGVTRLARPRLRRRLLSPTGAYTDHPDAGDPLYARGVHETPPILIAEDNDDDFFFFRRAVRMAGIESPLLRFRDGSELVAFVEKNSPGVLTSSESPLLVFVDLTMPIMNGFEVLEWLKEHAPGHYLPVVLSGSRREDDLKRAYALGAHEYLVKPISPVLLAAIAARPAPA